MRPVWRASESLTHPGILAHYWHRKRWIESRCRVAIKEGVTHVVVIGAGFDTLALRLAGEFPDVRWIELDHPATQGAKQRGLNRGGLAVPSSLHTSLPWAGCLVSAAPLHARQRLVQLRRERARRARSRTARRSRGDTGEWRRDSAPQSRMSSKGNREVVTDPGCRRRAH